ncbi:MAG: LCP family protein, partial [Candidatus Saccharimonadales bacterium]
MEEETPRPRKDNAYNRRNLFIDGVSGPVKPRPHPGTHLTPQADSAPKPIETKASVEDSISPKSSSGEDTSRPEPSSSQVKTSGNETPSLIGSTLPSKGLSRNKKPPFSRRKSRVRRILKYSIIVLVIAIVGLSAWFGSSIVGSIDKAFHGNVFSDVHALISGSTLNESNGRINILLAGDSVDDPNHGGALLADSIMVISYDPSTKNGFLLSIPRDLWVNIPSLGHQKINAANTVTNFSEAGYPSGGIGQLQQIVQTDLGI